MGYFFGRHPIPIKLRESLINLLVNAVFIVLAILTLVLIYASYGLAADNEYRRMFGDL